MTEQTTEQATPLVWDHGTAFTPELASERLAALRADPEFKARIDAKDPAAFAENTRLWRIANGMPPEPQPPATPEEIRQQMTERDLAIDDMRLATLEKHVPMNDRERFEHRRGLATRQQVEDAKRRQERMLADRAFGARVLNGDRDAVDEWLRIGRVANMTAVSDDYDWSKS